MEILWGYYHEPPSYHNILKQTDASQTEEQSSDQRRG